jgi:tetratricopeptide (TPR) repeat protein
MKSLYEVLGARVDDDAQAIKQAFRTAVKASHPDLHPGDPGALLRFRRIVTANTILRDEKQRAAYDQLLEEKRQQLQTNLDQQYLRLQYQRRQARLKMGATAAVAVVCGLLAFAYGLFMPMPTTAVVKIMQEKPSAVKTASIVEAIKKDQVAAGPAVAARKSEIIAAASAMDVTNDVGNASTQPMAHAVAAADPGDDASRPRSIPLTAGKGDAALPDDEPPPLPNDAKFYRELGVVSYRIGDFPSAIVNLDEAIRLDPNDAQAYNIRGNAWDEIGVFENALADYDAAIRIDPNDPVLFHDRAIMWHRRGDFDKALVDLDRAIRFSFSDPNVYCDRGLIWYERGSHARAIADFDHALKLDPDFAAACISRGLILHRQGEFNVAFADLEKTIHISPTVFDIAKQRLASHP